MQAKPEMRQGGRKDPASAHPLKHVALIVGHAIESDALVERDHRLKSSFGVEARDESVVAEPHIPGLLDRRDPSRSKDFEQ